MKKMKNSHKSQLVNVDNCFQALGALKRNGNPYYQFWDEDQQTREEYLKSCKEKDPAGFKLMEPEGGQSENDDIPEDNVSNENHDVPETIEINEESIPDVSISSENQDSASDCEENQKFSV